MHASSGTRRAWEDTLVQVEGLDWVTELDENPAGWGKQADGFVKTVREMWDLPHSAWAEKAAAERSDNAANESEDTTSDEEGDGQGKGKKKSAKKLKKGRTKQEEEQRRCRRQERETSAVLQLQELLEGALVARVRPVGQLHALGVPRRLQTRRNQGRREGGGRVFGARRARKEEEEEGVTSCYEGGIVYGGR